MICVANFFVWLTCPDPAGSRAGFLSSITLFSRFASVKLTNTISRHLKTKRCFISFLLCGRAAGQQRPARRYRFSVSSPGPAMPRSMGRDGAGASPMRPPFLQACFSRTVRITRNALRISSSCSAASSTRYDSAPPQSGQQTSTEAVFIARQGLREWLARVGLAQRARYRRAALMRSHLN